ncbi:MAG: helix-turn-helix transcriptional regulator [Dehalococcoidia bacterium]|nr:helix-turn-helix transcriptional regulator [Dehalococcoidia bacterium]
MANLKYTLLGFLSYAPMTGYEISKKFFRFVRPAMSQIYRNLNTLAEEGYVISERIEQEKLPSRNKFEITEEGRRQFYRWVKDPPVHNGEREPIILKLWFGSRVSKDDLISSLDSYAVGVKEELKFRKTTARSAIKKGLQEFASPMDRLYWNLANDYAVWRLESFLEWKEQAIKLIEGFHKDPEK